MKSRGGQRGHTCRILQLLTERGREKSGIITVVWTPSVGVLVTGRVEMHLQTE